MSLFKKGISSDYCGSPPNPRREVPSPERLFPPSPSSLLHHPRGMASKEQQQHSGVSSDERVVHEINTVPGPALFPPLPPQPELHPMRLTLTDPPPLTSMHALDPVRWDWVTTPQHRRLQRMDQELQRLTGEMNRLWTQPAPPAVCPLPAPPPLDQPLLSSRAAGWLQPWSVAGEADLLTNRPLWSQSAVEGERQAEVQRLWQQLGAMMQSGNSTAGLAAVTGGSSEVPRGYFRLTPGSPTPQPLSVLDAAPWGPSAHAEAWRMKEDFLIDNPVVKTTDGSQRFCLQFDLRQFKAGEIQVTTDGHVLTVQAKHEEADDRKQARREYFRQCLVPQGVQPKSIVSQLSPSGILSVSAPLLKHTTSSSSTSSSTSSSNAAAAAAVTDEGAKSIHVRPV